MFFFKSQHFSFGGRDHADANEEIAFAEKIIPTEVLVNILKRLPAWSLQKLKPVSKQWFQIISDPDFVEAHVDYQSCLLFGGGIINSSSRDVLFIEGMALSTPNPPRNINLPGARQGHTQVHGSCKGLVLYECCLRNDNLNYIQFHVANPLTGDSLSLAPPHPPYHPKHCFRSASIGCSNNSREIKVVLVFDNMYQDLSSPMMFFVLTVGSNTWRLLTAPFPQHHFMPYEPPTLAGGALYWRYATSVLSLDLGKEKFHQTEMTFPLGLSWWILCEWDGCLGFLLPRLRKLQFSRVVWVLRESGWTVHEPEPVIDRAFFRRLRPGENFSECSFSCPYPLVTMGKGRTLLFWKTCGKKIQLLAYDIHSKELTNFTEFEGSYFKSFTVDERQWSYAHVNSLVSCSCLRKRVRASGKWKMKLAPVFNVLSNNLTSSARTIRDLLSKKRDGCIPV